MSMNSSGSRGPKPVAFDMMTPEEQAAVRNKFSQYDEGTKRYFTVQTPSRRFIKFDNAAGGVSNNGDAYSAIEH